MSNSQPNQTRKLSPLTVTAMQRRYAAGGVSQLTLAIEHDMSQQIIAQGLQMTYEWTILDDDEDTGYVTGIVPDKKGPELPMPCHDDRPIDGNKAFDILKDMCRG